jgi:hypothetical protein
MHFRETNWFGDVNIYHFRSTVSPVKKKEQITEEYCLLGYNTVWSVENQPAFRRNILPPSSGSKNKVSKKPELCLPPAFTLVSCSAYSSTLKMEAICSSETSVDFQRTTQRYIPEDGTLHNHRCENLKSYITKLFSKIWGVHSGIWKLLYLEIWRRAVWKKGTNSWTYLNI